MNKINVFIVGAGKAGELISKGIGTSPDSSFKVVGFIDDDDKKIGNKVNGINVLGKIDEIKNHASILDVKELLIAIPSERGEAIRRVVENTMGEGLIYKILPRRSEVLSQDFEEDYLRYIRRLRPEDLLGGEINKEDQSDILKKLKNETIMITGAAGSIGSELSRQISAYGAKKIIFFDWWENGMFELSREIHEKTA